MAMTPPWPTLAPMARNSSKSEPRVEQARRHDAGQRPADHQAAQRAAVQPAADVLDDLPQGDPKLDFVQPRPTKQGIQRNDFRTAAARNSQGRVLLGSVAKNPRHAGQRLDIVDDGRPAPQAMLGNIGRTHAGNGTFPFDGIQQRRFFTALITASTDDQLDIESRMMCPDTCGPRMPPARALVDGTPQTARLPRDIRSGRRSSPAKLRPRGPRWPCLRSGNRGHPRR